MAHPRKVQRLFTMFPRGSPGVALLLLRASVAVALLLEVFAGQHHVSRWSGWMESGGILLSVALCVGYLTPIVAVMGLLFHGLIWVSLGSSNAAVAAIVFLDATALALLGPGAYSFDSYRFGRRVLVLPPV
jgi:hypothetical protein